MTKREELFAAIGDIDDELIMRSLVKKGQKKKYKIVPYGSVLAGAACLMLLVNTFQNNGLNETYPTLPTESSTGTENQGGNGPDHPSDYVPGDTSDLETDDTGLVFGMSTDLEWTDFNAGPIMPLTFATKNQYIRADRELMYDFSTVVRESVGYVPVRDSYQLHNTSQQDQTVTIYYPYVSDMKGLSLHMPKVMVNNEVVNTNVINGNYMGTDGDGMMKLFSPNVTSDDYGYMVQDGKPLEQKLNEELLNREIVVYEFADFSQGTLQGEAPTYSAQFKVENPEAVFTNQMNSFYEDGSVKVSFGAESVEASSKPAIYFLDGEPTEYIEQGYNYIDMLEEFESDEVTSQKTVYKTTMKAVLKDLIKSELEKGIKDYHANGELEELYYQRAAQMFCDMYQWNTDGVTTPEDDIFYASSISDILYMVFDYESLYLLTDTMTIPAGGSVTVTFDYLKQGTYQTYEPLEAYRDNYCYDNMPYLGSNITYNQQVTSIIEDNNIRIESQNYGFDLEAGITSVVLNPDAERYYMIVKILK